MLFWLRASERASDFSALSSSSFFFLLFLLPSLPALRRPNRPRFLSSVSFSPHSSSVRARLTSPVACVISPLCRSHERLTDEQLARARAVSFPPLPFPLPSLPSPSPLSLSLSLELFSSRSLTPLSSLLSPLSPPSVVVLSSSGVRPSHHRRHFSQLTSPQRARLLCFALPRRH